MLENKLKNLPDKPGVYQFFNENGKLLYIGKAKSLKNRVKSYFKITPNLTNATKLSPRIAKMISETYNLEYFIVHSESDALILENSLIKQMKPKYNVLLRDDKTYPYIYIDLSLDFPRFEITRKIVKGRKIRYFGPYSNSCRHLFDAIYLLLPLVQKKSCIRGKKACLFYQMKKCFAPCENKISKQKYHDLVEQGIKLLNEPNLAIKSLKEKMQSYANSQNYEMAATIRDSIHSIEQISTTSSIDFASLENFDLFAILIENNTSCVIKIFVRFGKVISSDFKINRASNLEQFDKNSLYKQILLDFYPKNSPFATNKIFIADEIDELDDIQTLLSQRAKKKISITNPKKGEKKQLCDLALINAKELICKDKNNEYLKFLEQIKADFEFDLIPNSIEIFDNSHLGGTNNVGAMVCFENGAFNKSKYRHYHLSSTDEYSQMKELLTKRALKFDTNFPPELWVIDGGETLLNLASQIIQSSGANVDIIAIAKEKIDAKAHRAKGGAKDKLHTKNMSYNLTSSDKRLQFFQRLRDEAHRFAISFHRQTKRKSDLGKSNLAKKGISEANIKKLLDYFESFENVTNSSFDEVCKITNKNVAKKLFKI